jgi:hypothetical protein
MEEPKPVDSKTAKQLLLCGQVMGVMMRKELERVDPADIKRMLDQVDIEVLEEYLARKPVGFKYGDQVQNVISMARKYREEATPPETEP